jgi:hypothetical protein
MSNLAPIALAAPLEAFGVERPSPLFVKVEDRVDLDAKLVPEAA